MDIKKFYQIEYNHEVRTIKNLRLPINLNLILTKRCNSNCIHCCARANEKTDEFSVSNFKKIIKICKKNKIFYFVITGGEPLMYPHFWKVLDLLNNKFGVIINTNATKINESVAKKLSNYKIASVHVSFDAPNQKIYAKQRGKNTKIEEVIKGIRLLKKYNIPVTNKFIITEINKDYIEEVVKFSISLGVRSLTIAWFKPVGRGKENEPKLMIKLEETKRVMRRIYNLKNKYKEQIKINLDNAQCFPFLLKKVNKINYKKLCGDYFCRVGCNGDVYPCPFLDIKVGNIFEDKLENLWKNKSLIKLRKLSIGKNLDGKCKHCSYNQICAGGCRARALSAYNNLAAQDPLCWL